MSRGGGRTLADRVALAPAPPDARDRDGPQPGAQTSAGPVDPIDPARHCWVTDLPGHPGTRPGLLVRWRRDPADGLWQGRVVYAVSEDGTLALVESWVPARHLRPPGRGPDPAAL